MNTLRVTFQDNLSFSSHVKGIVSSGAQCLYALNVLKSHGLRGADLYNVCMSILVSRFTYASPAWWGFISRAEEEQINGILHKVEKWSGGRKLLFF